MSAAALGLFVCIYGYREVVEMYHATDTTGLSGFRDIGKKLKVHFSYPWNLVDTLRITLQVANYSLLPVHD